MSSPTDADTAWLAEQLAADDDDLAERAAPVDLDDEPQTTAAEPKPDEEPSPEAGKLSAKTKFLGLTAGAAVVVLAASTLFYLGSCAPDQTIAAREVADPVATAAPASPAAATIGPQTDRPLPYTADAAGSCPAGSTSAQTMDGSDPRNAFVCVRGGLDGQVITIDLPKTYIVTALVLTPGWVGKDASGTEQWAQHRVVTTVQYTFNDSEHTLITQDTQNVHGEATMAVKRVMSSRITMLIRQTSRPPAQPPATPTPPGGLDSILGDGAPTVGPLPQVPLFGQPANNSDPVDATFAISGLKIIGHEAI